jgi:diketogulonate reductase-like aldo/keto reductase
MAAANAAISAMAHSTTRIERSSTSVSVALTVGWRIIDRTPWWKSVDAVGLLMADVRRDSCGATSM